MLRGPHLPNLTGVGDKALSNGCRSYSLSKSSGDSGADLGTDVARRSRGGTLNARNGGAENGGTLKARDGAREYDPAKKDRMHVRIGKKNGFGSSFRIFHWKKRTSEKEIILHNVQRSHS